MGFLKFYAINNLLKLLKCYLAIINSSCKESCIKQDFTPCFAPMGNVMIGNKIDYNIIETT
jgi:hypothetical protein